MPRILLVAFLAGCAVSPEPPGLRARVIEALAPAGGEWGVYFRDLATGDELAIRADEDFHPASTLKIWVLIKIHEDIRAQRYFPDDEVEVAEVFRSAARKDPRPFKVAAATKRMTEAVGKRMSVGELVEHMMIESDNLATNNLIRIAGGPEAVTNALRRHGVNRSDVRRFIMDEQAFQEGMSSVARPRDFGFVLEKLARGEVISPSASGEILDVMGRLPRGMLSADLPPDAKVSRKPGAITGVRNDVGLVTLLDGRRYVAAFFSRGLRDEKKGEACLAAASRVLYEAVEGGRP